MNSKISNIRQIMLSSVALLMILLVAVGFTYCWIEGGTTYSVATENPDDVKTGTVPDSVKYAGGVILDPTADINTIDLSDYDETSHNYTDLYFSPVSSKDGKNFFFPVAYDSTGKAIAYRASNTNDIGTKLISYDFSVKATKKCYLAFNTMPTITATQSGTAVADTSAFRVMISNGATSHIFSTATTAQTTTVVTSTAGATSTLTTKLFSDYLNGSNKSHLFDYEQGGTGTITVSVWLDSGSDYSGLVGCDISIDMELIVDQEKVNVTYDAVTYNNAGSKVTNGFTGGKITVGSTTHSSKFTNAYNLGDTIIAKATANTHYTFDGWYTDSTCTNSAGTAAQLEVTPTADVTYYAKFVEKPKYTIKVVASPTAGGTVTAGGSSTSYTGYKDSTVTLKATPKTGYGFAGWYTDSTLKTLYSESESVTVTISAAKTYYAKFNAETTTTIYIQPRSGFSTYYLYAYRETGSETAHYTGGWPGTAATLDSTTGYYKITFKTTDSGTFNAIVNNNNGTQYPGSGQLGLEGTLGGTYLFKSGSPTALVEFDPADMITFKVSATNGTATVNGASSVKILSGDSVTLAATPNSGYTFAGWYTNSACTTNIGSNYKTANQTITYTGTAGSTVTYYAKFEESANYIYFTPSSNWESQDNPRYAIYVFGTSGNAWASMTEIGSSNVFKAEIPDGTWENIIFCRMNPNASANNWDNKWNQTGDLTLPTDGSNYFKFTSGSWDGGKTGTWSTYVEP